MIENINIEKYINYRAGSPIFKSLVKGCLHLWIIDINQYNLEMILFDDVLTEQERNHISDIIPEKARHQFIISKYFTRMLAAQYLSKNPKEINFEIGQYGKPKIFGRKLWHNVSHSQDLVIIGFVSQGDIGVDVEYAKREVEFDDLAKRCFTKSENDIYFSLDYENKSRAFYEFWTSKEAALKAVGLGLQYPMNELEVINKNNINILNTCWYLNTVSIGDDYAAAVVTKELLSEIICYKPLWGC